MARPPVVSGREAVKAFEKIGYSVVRQKGSHIRMRDDKNERHRPLTIPDHKELKPGLLRALMRDADLTVDEFEKLIKG
ncbi:MAG TPA: type II toxin-antitoxin system HicA family toxin [Anaerolineales bacterium]|nr:type II toxin-antitoxin system HicA family toxin [Anaerolineales bacterium]